MPSRDRAITSSRRAATAAKSMVGSATTTPYRPLSLTTRAILADSIIALLGVQPQLTQMPPI